MRHEKWISLCLKLAKKSKMKEHRHAAILVRGGKLISIGINKSKAGALADPVYELKGWHSELDCLLSVDRHRAKGAILYVAGITKTEKYTYSKPCHCCQQFISKYQLKGVYFHDQNGNVCKYA